MEKKDLIVLALAILVVMGIALMAKPFLGRESFFTLLPIQGGSGESSSPPLSQTPTSAIPSPTTAPVIWSRYAMLTGNRSGTTEEFFIPFSSWKMRYSANLSPISSEGAAPLLPRMRIQVVDADDPSRIVRSLEPDLLDARINTPYDPRPWTEQVMEGTHRYFLVIHIQEVQSYMVEILVPSSSP